MVCRTLMSGVKAVSRATRETLQPGTVQCSAVQRGSHLSARRAGPTLLPLMRMSPLSRAPQPPCRSARMLHRAVPSSPVQCEECRQLTMTRVEGRLIRLTASPHTQPRTTQRHKTQQFAPIWDHLLYSLEDARTATSSPPLASMLIMSRMRSSRRPRRTE